MRNVILCFVVLAAAAWRPASAGAADGEIIGKGTASMLVLPQIMRMEVEYAAEGESLDAAVERLEQLVAADRKKLVQIGAADASIRLDSMRVPTEQQRRAEQAARGRTPAPTTQASEPGTRVHALLTADFPLGSAAPAAMLKQSEAIRKQMAEAGLWAAGGGLGLRGVPSAYGPYGHGATPGEPSFCFVAKPGDAQRQKAVSEAFARAREDAQLLAKAAGLELGAIKSLSSQAVSVYDTYAQYNRQLQRSQYQRQMNPGVSWIEGIGAEPSQMTIMVTVQGTWAVVSGQ